MPDIAFYDGRLRFEAFDCICGRHHELPIRQIVAYPGAVADVSETLDNLDSWRDVLMVSDEDTFEAAGAEVERRLRDSGRRVSHCCFPTRDWVKPDEYAVGNVLLNMEKSTELLLVVGSGCLTDLTRFVSFHTAVPFVSVATAPSMDGYASNGSPMMHGGYKKTVYTTSPEAVIADIDVLKTAPRSMIASGFADTIGKLTSRIDWKLGNIVRGEYYCPVFVDLVDRAVERCMDNVDDIASGVTPAVTELTESLLISGVAMLIIGNSRPASGSEHSLSHYWEMKTARTGGTEFFHGTKVGVGTVVTALFADRFFARNPASIDPETFLREDVHLAEVESRLRDGLGPVAERIIQTVTRPEHLNREARRTEAERITTRWPHISSLSELCPTAIDVVRTLRRVGGAAFPKEIDVDSAHLRETLMNAKEVRSRYTLMRAAETLGWLEEICEEVIDGIEELAE